jgi:L-aminopeptidase/D-esterase-like protein
LPAYPPDIPFFRTVLRLFLILTHASSASAHEMSVKCARLFIEVNHMNIVLEEISINDIEGFAIGQAEDEINATGVTVILARDGACTGLDIRGGGPASRESGLLNPLAANDAVHAVVLSGGSAFGLDSASGVMQYLEEQKIGFPTAYGPVPIVCASCLFDLGVANNSVRPDAAMGYQACLNAPNFTPGNHGAGTGATVGKAGGPEHMMKSGIGSCAVQLGDLKVGAVVAVNAMGDIFDPSTGTKLAGMLDEDGTMNASCEEALYELTLNSSLNEHTNTTIGAILTNASFNKTELTKIAGMGHDGYARAINPVHTMFDGDSLYAMSSGSVKADLNVVGTLAARVTAAAIDNAVLSARSAYGIKSAYDL